jgi:hypothetical protein
MVSRPHQARTAEDGFRRWEQQTSAAIAYYITHIPSAVQVTTTI